MRRLASLGIVASLCVVPDVARAADSLEQGNQVMFGIMGAYVPQQNNLEADVAAVGHYVSFSHNLDFVYLGMRVALLYGWLPSGATGQQYVIEPDVLIGLRFKVGRPLALRLEAGTGPLVNGGEGFATTIIDHTYVRGSLQWTAVKALTLEAFVGPSFVIGPFAAAAFPEFGLGAGWSF